MKMPILYMRGNHFAISQFILRPFFRSIANSNIYPLLWSFSSYLLRNVSFTNSILILFGIKNYIIGKTTIKYLTSLIYSISPIIGNIFDSILKRELTYIRIYSTIKQTSVRRLISIIIINSFLLIFKSIFKFFSKIIIIIIVTTLSIFWLGAINNIKYLLNIAFEIKDLIFYYSHIELPIPDKFKINNSTLAYLKSFLNIFKDNKILPSN
uniref:Uncharacterized protein n=1 Tax=Fomitiporia mediterranea TaxID=208960 RepID=A0A5B9R9S0_9AGAM|nr:hypothetical protein Fomme_000102 [Fomitiporia mediterranea]QEG57112.1 hypothetical protein Fomme_000102 [Fomitiporia mediterranea]